MLNEFGRVLIEMARGHGINDVEELCALLHEAGCDIHPERLRAIMEYDPDLSWDEDA